MPFNVIPCTEQDDSVGGVTGGLPSDDLIDGLGGNDTIQGGAGNDRILGGAGNDNIVAGDDNDTVDGGDGDDAITGNAGDDLIRGNGGNDRLEGGGGSDTVIGGGGNDTLTSGGAFDPGISGLYGGSGNDALLFSSGQGGLADGGTGADLLWVTWYETSAVTFGLSGGSVGATTLVATGMECLLITTFLGNDTITGGDLRDEIWVNQGLNVVDAGGGNDLVVVALDGTNHIDGGTGTDVLRILATMSGVLNLDLSGMVGTDQFASQFVGIERYQVYGTWQNEMATLASGHDLFRGNGGIDLASGGGGDDRLFGGIGSDTLAGDGGSDWMAGGAGADALSGGSGADNFVFARLGEGPDHIFDFATGEDVLVFHADLLNIGLGPGALDPSLFANESPVGPGWQFVLISSSPGTLASLRLMQDTGSGILSYDLFTFANSPGLTASDILLI